MGVGVMGTYVMGVWFGHTFVWVCAFICVCESIGECERIWGIYEGVYEYLRVRKYVGV